MSADLVAFLRARLDEDEATARAAVAASDRLWALNDDQLGRPWVYDSDNGAPLMEGILGEGDREVLTHVVVHHPDRVLREVEAKRRIVHEFVTFSAASEDMEPTNHEELSVRLAGIGIRQGLSRACAHLAAAYSDHPDYRDGWAL